MASKVLLQSALLSIASFSLVSARAIPPPTGNGPALNVNFPDPTILYADNMWYAFATNNQSAHINVQIASSPDFTTWTYHAGQDAMPQVPQWAVGPWTTQVWAPDVNETPDGSYVMYFAALTGTAPRKHCIGTATSASALGPFVGADTPLICDLDEGGNIDPNLFTDPFNKNNYLIYKVDGNAIGSGGACGNSNPTPAPTPLRQLALSSTDLLTPEGPSSFVLDNVPADGPNIERPSIHSHNGSYYLLYNSGCFTGPSYEVRYLACYKPIDFSWCDWTQLEATATAAGAPQVLLSTGTIGGVALSAPGSVDVSPDGTKMLFHGDTNLAWYQAHNGANGARVRALYAAELVYDDQGQPSIGGFY